MPPEFAVARVTNRLPANAENVCPLLVVKRAISAQSANIRLTQLRSMMAIAKLLSTLGDHICLVLCPSADEQMVGVDAATVVTAMQNAAISHNNTSRLQ